MAGRNSGLTLVVSANTDAFQAKTQAISRALDELARDGGNFRQTFDKIFDEISANPAEAIRKMTSGLRSEVQTMMREARAAAELGKDFNPVGGMSSGQSLAQAANYDKIAQALRQKVDASLAAAQADERHSMAAKQLESQLWPEIRALEAQAVQLRDQATFLAATETQLQSVSKAQVKVATTSGSMRAGMQQLSFQVSDVATQFAAGTPAMVIFAQQSGQVAQAVGMMAQEGRGLLGFLGGPWGIAILSAGTVLGTLIAKSDMFSDSIDREAKLLDQVKFASDGVASAQSILANVMDLTTGKITAQNAALLDMARAQLLVAKATAETNKAKAGRDLQDLQGKDLVFGGGLGGGFSIGRESKATANTIAAFKAGIIDGKTAQDKLAALKSGGMIGEEDYLKGISAIANFEFEGRNTSAADAGLRMLDGNATAADRRLLFKPVKGSKAAGTSASEQDSLGDMTALLKELFPGVVVTAKQSDHKKLTKGGKISDHFVGRAIDFAVPGQMSPEDFVGVQAKLEAAGVQIRRNAEGKLQFFGPGHGPNGPGDKSHEGHYHVAWQGKASPENASRLAEQQAEKARRSREAYEQAMDRAQSDRVRAERESATDAGDIAQAKHDEVEAALESRLDANRRAQQEHDWTDQQRLALDAQDVITAKLRHQALDADRSSELKVRELSEQRDALQFQSDMLELAGQMAPTVKERAAIALQLLENERKQAKLANDIALAEGQISQAKHDEVAAQIDQRAGAQRPIVERQNQGAWDSYKQRLKDNVGDINESLAGVKVNGLQSLEEGLLGVINGTETVAGAFKRMAASIIADLARIAIEKAIVMAIQSFAGGDVPSFATGQVPGFAGGVISGPGTGTSDSILALHQSMGLIRVSNGESIITAEGTRKHRKLLKAINDNTLPSFSQGLVDIEQVSYPRLPEMQGLRAHGSGMVQQTFDLRGAVVMEDLYREMHAIAGRHAAAALQAAPILTRHEFDERASQRIPV